MNDLIGQIERGESKITITTINPYHQDPYSCAMVRDRKAEEEILRLAKLGQQRDWIPVTPETMPEDGQRIIVCDTECGVGVGKYLKGMALHNKQYWMPLPALPEQENDKHE